MTAGWFAETLYPDFQQRFQIDRVLYEGRTALQDVLIFESARFGRVLTLDGIIQTTDSDEYCYHEMLAHVPILAHGAVRRVCIVGGGDGGVLREVLRHPIDRAVMVEIDGGVVEVTRKYLPELSAGAFDDSRGELIIADGVRFMRETDENFDVIIVDSTDPVGPSVPLFGAEFYRDCRDRLGERGILLTQSGVTFMQSEEARDTYRRMAPLFADAAFCLTQVPSYGAGFMTLGWGCNSTEPRATPLDEIERRYAAANIGTRYYNPATHFASFALPGYIEALKT